MTDHLIVLEGETIICDACGDELKKGDYYQEADAGERYCQDCCQE